ncbi:hypothetical protein HO133_010137 [Letharia lupina]|uniref:SAC3/GANP/THP3 conserved domain-containing protein n=1 Tax=Letharia lupina TaxID=560253 RepID=A0A8H6FEI6_9LECA|nr:uncharacterized protein HO133_010137 [Letharia lupina]KAF6224943.1 hypothetical protein HO133_010137 [Letharia lupina]
MSSHGAFTSVSARRTFARPTPAPSTTPSPPPSAAEKAKRDWPESVRHYVQRAFATENTIASIPRQEMEIKLKKIISNSAENNTLGTIDWAKLPLPQQMILEERARPALLSANPPWGNGLEPLSLQETNVKSTDTLSKKRKSSELDLSQNGQEKVPPWRIANPRNVFEDRITHPDKRQRNDVAGKGSSKSHHNLANRKKRFEDGQPGYLSQQPFSPSKASIPPDVDQGPVIGRSQDLEKRYFRLTSAPNPDTVRPLPVLEKTLEFLKRKWKKENNYSYICDQFKSLRQDLTVQHIKTEFTVSVYEIHARIALEKGDLGEYNQCQTQLRALYSQHLGGHPEEFKAYRILYFIHTSNRTDMNDVLADLTPTEKRDPAVKHALDARSALALANYHRFFQLYLDTPNMGAYLLDMFVARERLNALSNICISYKPDVRLRFFTEELGFESDDESARFICDQGGQSFLEERDGEVRLLTGKALRFFETARNAAFKKVDIKGQI